MLKSLDEFEFLSDPTTDYKVSCTLASEKLVSPGFLSHIYPDIFTTCIIQELAKYLGPDHCFKFRVTCPLAS